MKRRPLPTSTVADLCEAHSWDDDINDGARFALEMAHKHLRHNNKRLLRLARFAERTEAENEHLKSIIAALTATKGGAA
jgi:hypothetical protein